MILGEIKPASEIGIKDPHHKYIWHACEICHKERWVKFLNQKARYSLCKKCAVRKVKKEFRAGKHTRNTGYVLIQIPKDAFFYPMAEGCGYMMEHRLVMAKHLGRCLQPWEIIHHKNGIKSDNRIENLELTTNGQHTIAHNKGYKDGYAKGLIDGRDKQIQELKNRIKSLEQQIKSSTELSPAR